MFKRNLVIMMISIVLSCSNTDEVFYSDIMTKQLKMIPSNLISELKVQKVIIINDPLFVDVVTIKGVKVSEVVISDELIPDPKKRYFIAHLIRNILIKDAIILHYDEQGNDFVMHPVIEVSEEFIYENRQIICEVIYYLLHRKYFSLYNNPGSAGDKFFFSPFLKNIKNETNQLWSRLIEEDALIFVDYPVDGVDGLWER